MVRLWDDLNQTIATSATLLLQKKKERILFVRNCLSRNVPKPWRQPSTYLGSCSASSSLQFAIVSAVEEKLLKRQAAPVGAYVLVVIGRLEYRLEVYPKECVPSGDYLFIYLCRAGRAEPEELCRGRHRAVLFRECPAWWGVGLCRGFPMYVY